MIYFDNAATAKYKPLSVMLSLILSTFKYYANPGRSGHTASIKTALKVQSVRESLKDYFNADTNQNIIFCYNCTDALNLAILGTAVTGGNVIADSTNHNSVLRPLYDLQKQGKIDITIINPNSQGKIEPEEIAKHITDKTYLVCINHTSNVTGVTQDIQKISDLCKSKHIMLLVDSAQSAGHLNIDMQKQNISMLAFAGHKGLHGIQGIGGLVISPTIALKPIRFGGTGTMSESVYQPITPPEAFESGTIGTPAILALGAGLKWTKSHFNKINNKIHKLSAYILNELYLIKNVTVYTPKNSRSGVISFNIKDKYSSDVSDILNYKYKICTRPGIHCAPLIHTHLKTLETGTVRISIDINNTLRQAKKLVSAIKEISSQN
ncbi:MAG: aminotransferase class V-fold PLP-dependent enzyme [Clostridia bacterium]|jgi:cysteine desulfurase family protein|nr:aminotransferase class V-fold PLP-dependent enzyme [Clostridia bacterium]